MLKECQSREKGNGTNRYCYSVDADMKAVSEMLGHASTKVTYDTYTHLSGAQKKEYQAIVKAIKIS